MGSPEFPATSEYAATTLRRIDWSRELEVVRPMFREYRDWLAAHAAAPTGPDSRTPDGLAQFDRVISELPGAYGPPSGDVILAVLRADIVACGALHAWEPRVAEIQRIYVRADHRGPVFGPRLVDALRRRAVELGYRRVRVDALPSMEAAIQYYQELGFRPVAPYRAHPVPGARFFEWSAEDDPPTRR